MNSLRRRLTVSLIVSLALLTTLSFAALYPFLRGALLAEFDYALESKARILTSFVEPGRQGINLRFTETALAEFVQGGTEYFEVVLGATNILARSPSLNGSSLAIPAGAAANSTFWNGRAPDGTPWRAVALRFPNEGEYGLTVALAKSRVELNQALAQIITVLAAGALAILAAAVLLVRAAVRFGLAPAEALAREVSRASLDSRISAANAPQELQPIVTELNSLLRRLNESFERERRFTADAAHELSTPVAELRSASDIALKWPDDPAVTAGLARTAREISLQMERVLRVLLALARSQSAGQQVSLAVFDLAPIIQEIFRSVESRVAEKEITLTTTISPLEVKSDANLLRAILFNLVDNAVEYTPAQGRVHCEIADRTFLLRNSQAALSAEDLPRLCEPFWRKDPARSDSTHTGLGLALVQSYAKLLDLDLRLALEPAGDFSVTLSFPPVPA